MQHFEEFFKAYLECALWSSIDNADEQGGEPLDTNYTADDFEAESLETLRAIARVFYYRNACYIAALPEYSDNGYKMIALAGHDLWLTQCQHGTGFWDREYWGCYRDMFDNAAKALGNIDIMVNDGELTI